VSGHVYVCVRGIDFASFLLHFGSVPIVWYCLPFYDLNKTFPFYEATFQSNLAGIFCP
jgi:hypothetical protein